MARQKKKRKLPGCGFCGIFKEKVTNQNLVNFSGFLPIDIDNLDKQKLECTRKIITSMSSCVICYTTPSGRGLKACIWVGKQATMDDRSFKIIFAKLELFFIKQGIIIDPAYKDIRRIHFLAYDPEAYKNYNATKFDLDSILLDKPVYRPNARNEGFKLFECIKIHTALQKIHPDGSFHFNSNTADGDYQFWLEIGMAIHHASQGAEIGLDLWDEWSQRSNFYDKEELSEKWESFSSADGGITIGTLFKKSRYQGEHPDLNDPAAKKWIKDEVSHNLKEFNKWYAFIDLNGKAFIVHRARSGNGLVKSNMSPWPHFKTLHSNKKLPELKHTKTTVKLIYKPITAIWENSSYRNCG